VVQWRLREPHVERRIARTDSTLTVRDGGAAAAPVVNETIAHGLWRGTRPGNLELEARRVWVEVPAGFTEMQQQEPELALEWRHHTRAIFEHYFAQGYRAVDFELQREHRRGRYLLARP
jgi:chorismate synthase